MKPEERIADLEEEVRVLKAALGLGFRFPSIFHFTKREQTLLGILVTRRIMTYDMMILGVYGGCVDGGPDGVHDVLHVNIMILRKKLKRFGVTIQTVNRVGYEISAAHQKLLREIMVRDE
jgi:DNA-binding response OmpR family regulator